MSSNRRGFLRGAAALGVAPLFVPRSAWGANDRIAYAVIATGGRGRYLLEKFQSTVRSASHCAMFTSRTSRPPETPPSAKAYVDYKELLGQSGDGCRRDRQSRPPACADALRRA